MATWHRANASHFEWTLARRGLAVLGVSLSLFVLADAAAAQVYPSTPFDFAHPATPHFGDLRFTPTGGETDRPILVIYPRWDDVGYPPDFDAATVASRFFGAGFPSVADYYDQVSFHDLSLFPAAETQGTVNDGVVQVTVSGTKAAFFNLAPSVRNRVLLQLADPFVDYASFDLDGNGSLNNFELVVNAHESEPVLPLWSGCGITAGVAAVTLDNKGLGGLAVAMTNTASNLITIIHENGHAIGGMTDLYGFDVGSLDLGAGTCGGPDTMLFAPNAWNKTHWGWIVPTVVTADGYFDIGRADTTGDAFLLYDPDRGTDDYFILEVRRPTQGTYDQGINGDGLVIWRLDDGALGVSPPIGLMRPAGGVTAWDAANLDPFDRTMVRPWTDGTPSHVAVRAIGPAGDTMRAYLDVRGPGILVDSYPLDANGPVPMTAAAANEIRVLVMNTGEVDCDTFVFEAVDLPPAWTMSSATLELCADESTFARVTITPDGNADEGAHSIVIRGRSLTGPTLVTDSPLTVEVLSSASTLQRVAEELAALIFDATSPQVRAALVGALEALIGNRGGTANNGALAKLAGDDPVGAITRIQAAVAQLLLAEAQGAGDLSPLKDLLVLAAEAIAVVEYEAATLSIGTPSRGQARTLARVADHIAAGQASLQADQHLAACDAFRLAAAGAAGLAR